MSTRWHFTARASVGERPNNKTASFDVVVKAETAHHAISGAEQTATQYAETAGAFDTVDIGMGGVDVSLTLDRVEA